MIDLEKFKGSNSAQAVIDHPKPYNNVVAMCVNSFGPRQEKYFEAAVCMVKHINKISPDSVDQILVFNLGLTNEHKDIICKLPKVTLVEFPSETHEFYSTYFTPKHFAWKYAVTWYAGYFGNNILYMDAGKFPTTDLRRVFEVIEEDHFLLASPYRSVCSGEAFRQEWLSLPIGAGHPAVPITMSFLEALAVTPTEAPLPQCFAAIVGYKVGGKYHDPVIRGAFLATQDPRVCHSESVYQHTNDQALITLLAFRSDYKMLDMDVFRTSFGPGKPDQKRIIMRGGEDILVFWRAHGNEVPHLMKELDGK